LLPFNVVPEYIDARIMPASKQQVNLASTFEGVVMKNMKINFTKKDVRHLHFTHQADGGANFAATDRLGLLHDYRVYAKTQSIVAFFPQDKDIPPQEEHTALAKVF
jgi:hypothetical protein